jgi:hypothetical protein
VRLFVGLEAAQQFRMVVTSGRLHRSSATAST